MGEARRQFGDEVRDFAHGGATPSQAAAMETATPELDQDEPASAKSRSSFFDILAARGAGADEPTPPP